MPHSSHAPRTASIDRREDLLRHVIALEVEGTLQRHSVEFQKFPSSAYMRVMRIIADRVRWYLTYTGQLPEDQRHMTGDLLQVVRRECEVQTMWVLTKVYGEIDDPFGAGENEVEELPVEGLESAKDCEIPVAYGGQLPYSPPTFGCWYVRGSHPLLWMFSLGAIAMLILRVFLEYLSPLYSL